MRIIPVFVPHEGCPHDCVFCNQRRIAVDKSPDPEDVVRTIEDAVEKVGTGAQLAYYGGSFTAIEEERQISLLETGYEYVKKGILSGIRVSTRPDCIDERVATRLKKYNVSTVELGVQSMSDDILERAGRGHTVQDARDAVRLLKSRNFEVIVQVMTGLPGDSDEQTIYTAKETAALKPDGIRIYPVVVIRDTALYDMWKEKVYIPLTPREGAYRASLMLEEYIKSNIPVIRIGLNPTDELSDGGAVAGAYHPALGEMARGYVYRRLAESALYRSNGAKNAEIHVFPKGVSPMIGIKKENILYLEDKFRVKLKCIADESLDPYEVRVNNIEPGSGVIVSKIDRYTRF